MPRSLVACFPQHELVVTAESGGRAALTVLEVRVDDVNDNPPTFLVPDQRLTIVEEDDRDLPAIIAKVRRAATREVGGEHESVRGLSYVRHGLEQTDDLNDWSLK